MFRNFIKVPLKNVRYLHDRKLPSVTSKPKQTPKKESIVLDKKDQNHNSDNNLDHKDNEYEDMKNYGTSIGFNLEKYN